MNRTENQTPNLNEVPWLIKLSGLFFIGGAILACLSAIIAVYFG